MKRNINHSRAIAAQTSPVGTSRLAVRAFTLVELLVVLAITSIILFLLFGPIISSFNLTRRARAVSQAQDAARFGLERLTRELGRATYIYDNGLTPVAIPMYQAFDSDTVSMVRRDPASTPATGTVRVIIGGPNFADWATGPSLSEPEKRSSLIAYGRIDLAQPAVRQDAGDIIDPTTGQPVGGAELRPGVRGKRITRYFLGLRYPYEKNPDGSLLLVGGLPVVRLYQNRYEFQRFEDDNNPVILYRAEYDPTDPNLFDTDPADYSSTVSNSGGFNDPAFFYATNTSKMVQGGNGKTYGENWQAISQPVLVSESVDLLRWNRVGAARNRNEKDANDPFVSTTSFAPVAVPDDVAAPGFLTSGGVETPAAVPTLYQTKYAAWTYPYTITVLRGSTNYNGTASASSPFGTLKLTVDRTPGGEIFISNTTLQPFQSSGTLTTNPNSVYALYSPVTRRVFVKTARLTFTVDADRGRIETAFPPLMGAQNGSGVGVPYYRSYLPTGVLSDTVKPIPSPTPTLGATLPAGELIPTFFSIDTRDPQAGVGTNPTNLGIFEANLFAANYAPLQNGLVGMPPPPKDSPLFGFGEKEPGVETRGVRIIPGSERLTAPVSAPLDEVGTPTSWSRVAGLNSVVQEESQFEVVAKTAPMEPRFTTVAERKALYAFNYDFYPTDATVPTTQLFQFDFPGTPSGYIADGKYPSGMAAARTFGKNFLTATYQWQNNYSRNPCTTDSGACAGLLKTWGHPINASGVVIGPGSASRPEADIFRIDYATRQQYSINLGARIYDPTDGSAQTIQVTDKVIINNVLR